jgi:hypothetical protein
MEMVLTKNRSKHPPPEMNGTYREARFSIANNREIAWNERLQERRSFDGNN